MARKDVSIILLPERCKECGICIEMCPQKVFTEGIDDKPVITRGDACKGCRLCEYYCPDFAVRIEMEEAKHG